MSPEQEAYLLIKGSISIMSKNQQKRIEEAHDKIIEIMNKFGDEGQIAIALCGAELAAKLGGE